MTTSPDGDLGVPEDDMDKTQPIEPDGPPDLPDDGVQDDGADDLQPDQDPEQGDD
jgi:hypothetical protein